uniref:Uncharacterized protein n=1 Tax=Cacopsylla melanoneura TaxID=428564 RepID=A0A8D9FIA4_9HEMI
MYLSGKRKILQYLFNERSHNPVSGGNCPLFLKNKTNKKALGCFFFFFLSEFFSTSWVIVHNWLSSHAHLLPSVYPISHAWSHSWRHAWTHSWRHAWTHRWRHAWTLRKWRHAWYWESHSYVPSIVCSPLRVAQVLSPGSATFGNRVIARVLDETLEVGRFALLHLDVALHSMALTMVSSTSCLGPFHMKVLLQ